MMIKRVTNNGNGGIVPPYLTDPPALPRVPDGMVAKP